MFVLHTFFIVILPWCRHNSARLEPGAKVRGTPRGNRKTLPKVQAKERSGLPQLLKPAARQLSGNTTSKNVSKDVNTWHSQGTVTFSKRCEHLALTRDSHIRKTKLVISLRHNILYTYQSGVMKTGDCDISGSTCTLHPHVAPVFVPSQSWCILAILQARLQLLMASESGDCKPGALSHSQHPCLVRKCPRCVNWLRKHMAPAGHRSARCENTGKSDFANICHTSARLSGRSQASCG